MLADPAPGDDGNDDRAKASRGELLAWDDTVAGAIAARPALRKTTSGLKGATSDPWVDLKDDRRLGRSRRSGPGNVVQGARTRLTGLRGARDMTLALGFGPAVSKARAAARKSLAGGFGPAAKRYAGGWSRYLRSLRAPPKSIAASGRLKRLYQQSLMVLAASEDKLNRGASIAAPNMPWVWGTLTLEKTESSAPYHLVWPRDFYHVVTAQQAAGDAAAATRQLDYLWKVQKADGSWWQNTEVDGQPHWTNLQMDEVALPVVLAWWLGRRDAADWEHIRRAADFIVANGPKTGQERWENQDGWSPNTIATEIAGLVCAADVARRNGDPGRAQAYEAKADEWQGKVEEWTATDNGPYEPRPYYLRITKDAKPNVGTKYGLGDNFPRDVDQREIVDNSVPGTGPLRSQALERPDGAELPRGGRSHEPRAAAAGPRRDRSGTASPSTGMASSATAATGTSSPPPRARRAGACGRSSRASAASTSCSRAGTRRRTSAPSRGRRTTG